MGLGKFGEVASRCSWLPLGAILWAFTPMRRVSVYAPQRYAEPYTNFWGFPFLAESDAPHMGMYREVYLGPLTLNLMFFAAVAALLGALWSKRSVLRHRAIDWIVGVPTYAIGLFLLYAIIAVASDWTFVWWIDKSGWERVDGFVLPMP